METSRPTATFVVRGSRPVSLEVQGRFDAGAAVGFQALVPSLVGAPSVVLDLRRCETITAAAEDTVRSAVERIRSVGGSVLVHRRPAHALARDEALALQGGAEPRTELRGVGERAPDAIAGCVDVDVAFDRVGGGSDVHGRSGKMQHAAAGGFGLCNLAVARWNVRQQYRTRNCLVAIRRRPHGRSTEPAAATRSRLEAVHGRRR